MKYLNMVILTFVFCLTVSCNQRQQPSISPISTHTITMTSTNISSFTPTFTPTSSKTSTITPTQTITPSITPTPTRPAISPENVEELDLLYQAGKGTLQNMSLRPDGDLVVISSGGIFIYDKKTWNEKESIQPPEDILLDESVLSADGTFVASVTFEKKVIIWNVHTREVLHYLPVEDVRTVAFNADGSVLATGGLGEDINLWNVDTGEIVNTYHHVNAGRQTDPRVGVDKLIFSSDGRWLASAGSYCVRIWDTITNEQLIELTGMYTVKDIAFSQDGNVLAFAPLNEKLSQQNVWIVDTNTGKDLNGFNIGTAISVAFSPDGNKLATGGYYFNGLDVWDVQTGELVRSIEDTAARELLFNLDGNRLLSAFSDINVWNVDSGLRVTSHGGYEHFTQARFNFDGNILATGGMSSIRFWDVDSGNKILEDISAHGDIFIFTPDGELLITRAWNNDLRKWVNLQLWNVDRKQRMHLLEGTLENRMYSSLSPTFSNDGQLFAVGTDDKYVKVWEVESGKLLMMEQHPDIKHLSFSADGDFLATSGSNNVVLWDARTGDVIHRFWQPNEILTHAISPDDSMLVIVDRQDVSIWDVETREQLVELEETRGTKLVSFSPDGQVLALLSTRILQLWDPIAGKLLSSFEGDKTQYGIKLSLQYTPDGQILIVTGLSDDTIQLFDVSSGQLVHTIKLSFSSYDSSIPIAISHDGKKIALVSVGGTIRLYGIKE